MATSSATIQANQYAASPESAIGPSRAYGMSPIPIAPPSAFVSWKQPTAISPNASVAIARYGPRKRSATNPKASPTSAATTTPSSAAGQNGQFSTVVQYATPYAPIPKKPACPTEIWLTLPSRIERPTAAIA